jgi:hypothetical protein
VVRTLLKLWLLVREWNKGDISNLVSAVAYLDTGKYPDWICGYLTVVSGTIGSRSQIFTKDSVFKKLL